MHQTVHFPSQFTSIGRNELLCDKRL